MQIIVVRKNLQKSTVNGLSVEKLPPFLRKKVISLLRKLPTDLKRIEIKKKVKDAILEITQGNITPDLIRNKKTKAEFLKKMGLLRWYFSGHWYIHNSRALTPPVRCAHCHIIRQKPNTKYCLNPECPSHQKWKLIIGPSYKKPRMKEYSRAYVSKQMGQQRKAGWRT